jgi:hypothetical protein
MIKLSKTMMALSTVASLGVAAVSLSTAHADAFYSYYPTAVQINGTTVSTPSHITSKDPFGGANAAVTSFIPIWYINQALGKFNVTANWDGNVLNLTTPSGMTVNYPAAPKSMTITPGVMEIQINGKTVNYAPRISTYDSGTVNLTTFVPIYYVMKSLQYMGVSVNWDGTDWSMQYGAVTPPPTGSTPKLDAAVAFAKAIGLSPVNAGYNPYGDVPNTDAGYVNALTQAYKGTEPIIKADTANSFGASDTVTATTLANAFAVSTGVGTQHQAYLPSGSTVGLASAVGLMSGVPVSGDLSSSQVSTFMNNLATVEKGYVALGNNTYRLVYKPNYFGVGFNTSMPASTFASDWGSAIKTVDSVTVQYTGSEYVTTTAVPSDAGWGTTSGNYLEIQGGIPGQSYSLNNGATWHTASGVYGFDSLDPNDGGSNNSQTVELKSNQYGNVIVRYDYNGSSLVFAEGGFEIRNGQPAVAYQ